MLAQGVRYALGRQSYVVGTTISYVKENWEYFNDKWQKAIRRDIEKALERDDAGQGFDKRAWKKLLEEIKKEW